VIPSDELHSVGVSQFEACEEGYGFHAEQTSVHIVTCIAVSMAYLMQEKATRRAEEQVVGVRSIATYAKYLNQIVELSSTQAIALAMAP